MLGLYVAMNHVFCICVLCKVARAVDSSECEAETMSFESATCDLKRVNFRDVTRELLVTSEKPLIIEGLTSTWPAMQHWTRSALLEKHANETFHLHPLSNATIGDLLKVK